MPIFRPEQTSWCSLSRAGSSRRSRPSGCPPVLSCLTQSEIVVMHNCDNINFLKEGTDPQKLCKMKIRASEMVFLTQPGPCLSLIHI